MYFEALVNDRPVLHTTFRPQWGVYGEVGDYPLDLWVTAAVGVFNIQGRIGEVGMLDCLPSFAQAPPM